MRTTVMPPNSRMMLERAIEKERSREYAEEKTPSEYFNIYVAKHLLKDQGLDYEELEHGIVDGGGDGGIDSIYSFINGRLIQDDDSVENPKENVTLSLHIIQCTTHEGFKETGVQKIKNTLVDLLDFSADLETDYYVELYNQELRRNVINFQHTHKDVVECYPTISVHISYASFGEKPDKKVELKAAELKKLIEKRLLLGANVDISFLGCRELMSLGRKSRTQSRTLVFSEAPLCESNRAFMGLVTHKEYSKFILKSDRTDLDRSILEANVREYEGEVEVNKAIRTTLEDPNQCERFWWLNNGITVLATRASQMGNEITLENPQIVNGLQTSTEIANYLVKSGMSKGRKQSEALKRKLLVRVFIPEDKNTRYEIIKATNSQTRMPPSALRSIDDIHKYIEEYFSDKGLYYDRQKNFYRNEGKPRRNIITIPYLAQAVASILLQEPDQARARPSNILKNDVYYDKAFNERIPLNAFYVCVRLMKAAEMYLQVPRKGVNRDDRINVKFHLAMCIACKLTRRFKPKAEDIGKISIEDISDKLLGRGLRTVVAAYTQTRKSLKKVKATPDRIGKSKEFAKTLRLRIKKRIKSTKSKRKKKRN